MAGSDSFAALSRHSKRGVSPTVKSSISADADAMAPAMTIGAVDEVIGGVDDYSFVPPEYANRGKSKDNIEPNVSQEEPTSQEEQTDSTSQLNSLERLSPNPLIKNPFEKLARASTEDLPFSQRVYPDSIAPSPFAGLERNPPNGNERAARKDIHAIKVVTRLIQGISFNPGSNAPNSVKSATLRDQLILVHRLACEIALAAAPEEAHRPWVMAQCSEAVADLVARRSELSEDKDDNDTLIQKQVKAVVRIFQAASSNTEIAAALDGLSANHYVEATDPSIVRDRLSVSIAAATWDLHEKVVDSGFSFGIDSIQMVEILTDGLIQNASKSTINLSSMDMQTAHLQGSIRRLCGLIAAEYVSRAKTMISWIEDGRRHGDDTRTGRATNSFKSEILPELLSNAQKNFVAIEKIAPRLLAEVFQETNSKGNKQNPDSALMPRGKDQS